MSVSFQVRKNTTPFPRGKNQIVMFLFLIWLLRWANLFMCRLPPFLQTFPPTLFGAHTVRTGAWLAAALPWHLCLNLGVDNASSFCPTRTTPSGGHILPCAIRLTGHQAPRAEVSVPDSHRHHQAVMAAQQTPWNLPVQMGWILRPLGSLGTGRLQHARWLWWFRRSDPPEPLEMQYLEQISVRDGFRNWSITGSGEV